MAFVSKNVGPEAAVIAGRSREMDRAAEAVLRGARIIASAHADTGNYIEKLSVQTVKSRLPSRVGFVDDRLVVSDDEASASIEWGHMVRYKNARRVRWVPGQHILTRAMGAVR